MSNIYTVYINECQSYLDPWFEPNHEKAERRLHSSLGERAQQPGDFVLFHVGFFNEKTGEITPLPKPERISTVLPANTTKTLEEIFGSPSDEDVALIDEIVDRFDKDQKEYYEPYGGGYYEPYGKLELQMDITAAHNKCRLNLAQLLKANEPDFAHDVFGIVRHLDRNTGELLDCFIPRCAT